MDIARIAYRIQQSLGQLQLDERFLAELDQFTAEFLQRFLDVRFVMPGRDGVAVPQRARLAVPDDLDIHDIPRIEFCTDNGAMIALAGYHRLLAGHTEADVIRAKPRWPMRELDPMRLEN